MQSCKECNATWEASHSVDVCPFCGANLKGNTLACSIEDAFMIIVERHGLDVFRSAKLIGLLGDYAPTLSRERKLVKVAVESGAYRAMCEAPVSEREQVLNKYVSILTDSFFIDETWAKKVLKWCLDALLSATSDSHRVEHCETANNCIKPHTKKESWVLVGNAGVATSFARQGNLSNRELHLTRDTVMPITGYVDGINLKQYLKKKGALSWRETLHFSTQIAKALSHAHSKGIIHMDIKPQNIILPKGGTAKVADFGIAQLEESEQGDSGEEAVGSIHYISPEQARGEAVDARSDIYSLGVVMYEMLTGQLPFDGETVGEVAMKHFTVIPIAPTAINPDIPPELEEITLKAMQPDPNDRYRTADEMLADLEDFRKGQTAAVGKKAKRIGFGRKHAP